ncbi:MAG: NAD(P)-binding domain-containing protein [Acholeplasmataceae bacterium]|nr:NAD(P)-binding domain-containing protein [Acholeplasmataceae bacterium]
MKFGIIGSGDVGKTLAVALFQSGQQVMVSSRAPEAIASFIDENPGILSGNPFETASFGEVIINCTPGLKSLDALLPLKHALYEKILIDLSNPLVFPEATLLPSAVNTDSLGEQIQRLLPETRVIKTLNNVNAKIMVNPELLGTLDHVMFISGNNFLSKQIVTDILKDIFGWKHVFDLGDITGARAQEMLLPLWLRIFEKTGSAAFNFNIVKKA